LTLLKLASHLLSSSGVDLGRNRRVAAVQAG